MGMGRKGVGNRKSDNEPQGLSSSSSATSDRNLGGVRVKEKKEREGALWSDLTLLWKSYVYLQVLRYCRCCKALLEYCRVRLRAESRVIIEDGLSNSLMYLRKLTKR